MFYYQVNLSKRNLFFFHFENHIFLLVNILLKTNSNGIAMSNAGTTTNDREAMKSYENQTKY